MKVSRGESFAFSHFLAIFAKLNVREIYLHQNSRKFFSREMQEKWDFSRKLNRGKKVFLTSKFSKVQWDTFENFDVSQLVWSEGDFENSSL